MKNIIEKIIEKWGDDFKGATNNGDDNIIVFKDREIVITNVEIANKNVDEIIEIIENKLN